MTIAYLIKLYLICIYLLEYKGQNVFQRHCIYTTVTYFNSIKMCYWNV